jgi:hypothetical protein
MTFTQFLSQALAVLVALGPVLLLLLPLVQKHVKDARLAKALQIVETLVAAAVANAHQSTVKQLKDPTQPGEWTPSAASKVKDRVIEDVKANAPEVINELRDLGIAWPNALLGQLVEKQVVAQKAARVPPAMAVSALPVSVVQTGVEP